MARHHYHFTSESVSEGHPDKVCDRISDEIVDLIYREARKTGVDPWSVRVACETLATTNRVVIAGEVRIPETLMKEDKQGNKVINPARFRSVARRAIRNIGYEQSGFHWKTAKIDVLLHSQSADIAQGVDKSADRQGDEGAGRPGHHVRLCLQGDAGLHAGADLLFAQDPRTPGHCAKEAARARWPSSGRTQRARSPCTTSTAGHTR